MRNARSSVNAQTNAPPSTDEFRDPAPTDLIPLTQARQLLPDHRPGQKLHKITLYRWIMAGKIRAWRIGRQYFVSKADVLDMAKPYQVGVPFRPKRVKRLAPVTPEWAKRILDRAGI